MDLQRRHARQALPGSKSRDRYSCTTRRTLSSVPVRLYRGCPSSLFNMPSCTFAKAPVAPVKAFKGLSRAKKAARKLSNVSAKNEMMVWTPNDNKCAHEWHEQANAFGGGPAQGVRTLQYFVLVHVYLYVEPLFGSLRVIAVAPGCMHRTGLVDPFSVNLCPLSACCAAIVWPNSIITFVWCYLLLLLMLRVADGSNCHGRPCYATGTYYGSALLAHHVSDTRVPYSSRNMFCALNESYQYDRA
jgi:hypothetical protein